MDLPKILAELWHEHKMLSEAIASVERLLTANKAPPWPPTSVVQDSQAPETPEKEAAD